MRDMINKLNDASIAYYKGNPIMTDYEYDSLYEKLKRLENETGIIYSDSPTQNVGAEPVSEIAKAVHDHPMLSLDKVHDADEIKNFGTHDIVAMYKADGLTVSATYIDGELTKLETRGNGEVGNDILFHASSFKNLPLHIDKKGKYVIDGEAVIKTDDFEKLKETNPEYKHPRNLAAGSLNVLDPNVSKSRCLRFYAWDVIEGGSYTLLCRNLSQAIELGFETVAYFLITKEDLENYNLNDLLGFIKQLASEESFPIDGVVFKFNNIPYGRSLGMTGHHPRNAIAYKYEDVIVQTNLIDIEWQLGKTGVLTPVAVFKEIEIDGTNINKASLSNISIMEKTLGKNPYVGQTVWVAKMNMIIPKIIRSIDEKGDIYEC